MNRTAWTRTTPASSFPSDRIKPNATQQPSAGGKKGKGKGTATPPAEPPKSRPVRQLEALIGELKAASKTQPKPDPKGGCFCQARAHGLSPHTALCRTCGLVLCTVNAPQHACPSCGSSLLTETQRTTLITRLEAELADTLAKEERTRLQAAEEARRAVGAFPTLSGAPPAPIPSQPPPQTRTVLSLNPKTKRVTVSAFTKVPVGSTASTPGSSAPSSRPVSPELDPPRVTAPPPTVAFVAGARIDPSRPYADLSGNGAVYIPPPDFGDEANASVESDSAKLCNLVLIQGDRMGRYVWRRT
ncbi:zf-C2HC5 domain-containing protein [Mycena indigotica]|uniref:Zf-C2HC5 domain-containing protein n=1 Tax=Mycena indigotica TaxID=2126181 RepID=A0A8H6VYW9_9AGAR|nr:zf-C2HC5 domain-containing protein [Mycena indigotica]KAF7296926.1 zf-C2HC5 domain-containing protein [Mycena indigotica]